MKDIIIGTVLLLMAAVACMTPKKATDYLKKKGALNDTCAANYPVKADTIFKEGELIVETTFLPSDTLVFFDTVNHWRIDTIRKVCKPSTVTTIYRTDTFTLSKEDSAAISALRGKYNAAVNDAAKWKVKAKARGKLSWAMIGVITLLLVLLGFIIGKKLKLPFS